MSEIKVINGPMRADGKPFFHRDFRKQWNDACHAAGITSIGKHTAAKLLAILYVLGSEREDFTHSEKLEDDIEYIENEYGFQGGMTPDDEVSEILRSCVKELEQCREKYPNWAIELMEENYGIKL